MSYAADQIRRVLSHGPVPGEDFYRLKVSGYTNTQWVNITPAELEEIADLLDDRPRTLSCSDPDDPDAPCLVCGCPASQHDFDNDDECPPDDLSDFRYH